MPRQTVGDARPTPCGEESLPLLPAPRAMLHTICHKNRCCKVGRARRIDDVLNTILNEMFYGIGVGFAYVEALQTLQGMVLRCGKGLDAPSPSNS
jgi:hypothetical protein